VKFLVDENLSPRLAEFLVKSGHDAVHVRGLGAAGAPDTEVLSLAVQDERVIISADTDFGALLAHSRATRPSAILVRALIDRRPPELAGILVANLDVLAEHLRAGAGAGVAFTRTDIRVRPLPLR
jgi:predicted nuclease of predicted toxin-antitoxin system